MAADMSTTPTMDVEQLYREQVITDRRVGTIRHLIPIDADGNEVSDRPVSFIGEAQLYTPAGPLPLQFELEASNLREAVAAFSDAASQAVEAAMVQLKEMRRESASSIVVPGSGGGGGGGIQIP